MCSNGFLLTLDIERSACRRTACLILCLALAALVAVARCDLPPGVALATACVTVAAGIGEVRRQWPASPHFVVRVLLAPETATLVTGRRGRPVITPTVLVGSWVLGDRVAGLAFRAPDGGRHAVIVFRDRLPAPLWRRLRVRLRYGRS